MAKGNVRETRAKYITEEKGYEVLCSGWPDMLLWRESDKRAIFLEVKAKPLSKAPSAKRDRAVVLSPNQVRMHEVLKMLGLDVQIIYVGK